MRQATHFIEVVKYPGDFARQTKPYKINMMKWSFETNERHSIETIAIFKIYPKPVFTAPYDHETKAIIVE